MVKYAIMMAVLAVLLVVMAPAVAEDLSSPALYVVAQNQVNRSDGVYMYQIVRYSQLSTGDAPIYLLLRAEKIYDSLTPGADPYSERGLMNLTVSLQRANGTMTSATYSEYWDFGLNRVISTIVMLSKGDNMVASFYRGDGANNVTAINAIVVSTAQETVVHEFPSGELMSGYFAAIVGHEAAFIGDAMIVLKIVALAFIVIGVPFLIIIFFLWGFRKIKESAGRLMGQ